MVRPILALSILLLSLSGIFAVVGIAHSQPGCPRDSMRCGDPMQCPYHGPGLPLFRFPYGDEQNQNPATDSLLSDASEPMPTPVAPAEETINPIPETEANLPAEETLNVNESVTATETEVTETVVAQPAVVGRAVAGPVVQVAAEPVVEPASTIEEPATKTELEEAADSATGEDSDWNSAANSEVDPFGYQYVAKGEEFVPHAKNSIPRKALIARLHKRIKSVSQADWGLQLLAHGLEAREQVTQWSRDYKLERLAFRVVPPDKLEVQSSNPVATPDLTASQRQWLLGFAHGLNQFGTLIQGASRQIEGLAHDGAERQADARSGTTETR